MEDTDVREALFDHREALISHQKIAGAQVALNSSMLRRIRFLEIMIICMAAWMLILLVAIVVIAVKLLV